MGFCSFLLISVLCKELSFETKVDSGGEFISREEYHALRFVVICCWLMGAINLFHGELLNVNWSCFNPNSVFMCYYMGYSNHKGYLFQVKVHDVFIVLSVKGKCYLLFMLNISSCFSNFNASFCLRYRMWMKIFQEGILSFCHHQTTDVCIIFSLQLARKQFCSLCSVLLGLYM